MGGSSVSMVCPCSIHSYRKTLSVNLRVFIHNNLPEHVLQNQTLTILWYFCQIVFCLVYTNVATIVRHI